MKAVIILVLACSSVVAQTSNGLRRKYGPPVSETYAVRPDISVTVSFNEGGKTCEMLIEPRQPTTPIKLGTARLTLATLNEVIDELVPVNKRGKPLMAGFVNARCLPNDDCWGASSTYEKVFIYYNGSGKNEYRYATIQWRDEACHR